MPKLKQISMPAGRVMVLLGCPSRLDADHHMINYVDWDGHNQSIDVVTDNSVLDSEACDCTGDLTGETGPCLSYSEEVASKIAANQAVSGTNVMDPAASEHAAGSLWGSTCVPVAWTTPGCKSYRVPCLYSLCRLSQSAA